MEPWKDLTQDLSDIEEGWDIRPKDRFRQRDEDKYQQIGRIGCFIDPLDSRLNPGTSSQLYHDSSTLETGKTRRLVRTDHPAVSFHPTHKITDCARFGWASGPLRRHHLKDETLQFPFCPFKTPNILLTKPRHIPTKNSSKHLANGVEANQGDHSTWRFKAPLALTNHRLRHPETSRPLDAWSLIIILPPNSRA
ncbi:hypothetical protein BDZ45DRAFT_738594 [Acephala macrosclerotiorum]|nr:hypothetical protein BDZ45DRAFT_738594 [Acephala macrosclerotiorum]